MAQGFGYRLEAYPLLKHDAGLGMEKSKNVLPPKALVQVCFHFLLICGTGVGGGLVATTSGKET